MTANETIDLYCASATQDTLLQLANRMASAIVGVVSSSERKRRLKGIIGRVASLVAGYLMISLEDDVRATLDLESLSGMAVPLELDIDVPVGQTLAFYVFNTGTAGAVAVTALVERSK